MITDRDITFLVSLSTHGIPVEFRETGCKSVNFLLADNNKCGKQ
jgi:hypothetical protein